MHVQRDQPWNNAAEINCFGAILTRYPFQGLLARGARWLHMLIVSLACGALIAWPAEAQNAPPKAGTVPTEINAANASARVAIGLANAVNARAGKGVAPSSLAGGVAAAAAQMRATAGAMNVVATHLGELEDEALEAAARVDLAIAALHLTGAAGVAPAAMLQQLAAQTRTLAARLGALKNKWAT